MNDQWEVFIRRLHCPWWNLKHQVQAGEASREDVAQMLDSQQIPPADILPWLADVVREKQKFKPATKKRPQGQRRYAALLAMAAISKQKLPGNGCRGESGREWVINTLAEIYHVSADTVQRWVKEEREAELEAAKETGNPLTDFDKLLENAKEMAGIDDQLRNVQDQLRAATGPETKALAVEAESLVRQKIDLLNQRIESHKEAVAELPKKYRDAPSFQQRLRELESDRDYWLSFFS
jgi:hypothetical protein